MSEEKKQCDSKSCDKKSCEGCSHANGGGIPKEELNAYVYNELAKKTARWDIFPQIRQTFLLEDVQAEENGQNKKAENIESEKSAGKLGFFQKMRRKKEQKKHG